MDPMPILTDILFMIAGVFLDSSKGWFSLVDSALVVAGTWGILRKGGVKGWWALVPFARYEKLGKVAGREAEGRVAAVISVFVTLSRLAYQLIELCLASIALSAQQQDLLFNAMDFVSIVEIVASLIFLIYMIRIFLGLLEVYNRRRRWLLLWIAANGVVSCIWGWDNRFQPQWTAEEMRTDASTYFSNARASVLDQGLTVNLEERIATEFFQKKYLLRDIHMYIQPGHMVLLLGGSGAGKTTYLNAINGYEKAKAEVVLNGRNMYKEYKDMQYDIGFVPQLDLMRGSDSVYRTLMDAASLRLPVGFSKADRQARVEEVMNIFGLTPVQHNLVSKLSGGQRKRLSIAMEFISNPSLFILDEPDSGLDGVMARELFQQLRKIADQGKIIIVITHTPDRVIDLFDDVIVLAKDANRTGRLAFFGSIEEARAFFGREKMEEIVKSINRREEGGEGRADEFILKFAEVQHG